MAIYSDNFNRADSTTVGANWTEVADDWSIKSDALAPGLTTTGVILYNQPLDTADHYAEIAMSVASTTSMGVFARSDLAGNNFYLLRSNGTSWNLFTNISGTFTSIGSYAATLANGDVARIQCVGSIIKAFINGVERISVTNAAITTGTYTGIRSTQSSTARYDNFTASDVGALYSNDGGFFDFI
ncbi:MAG TPA: hypothetical protein VJ841_03695 [Candidatus Saccharimonadales bacterium]|nr:hypothetical protein [Candidatus Saccharimonadales bacterium]